MRSLRLLLPLGVGVALAVTALPVAAPAATPVPAPQRGHRAVHEYVSLGDSWTADVVVLNGQGPPDNRYAPIDCGQSRVNYPRLVARALGVRRFRDASCGSATTDDFARPQRGLPAGGTNPPQYDRLTRRTDLVTVGIGGNDAGIASAGMDCLNVLPVPSPVPPGSLPDAPANPVPFFGDGLPLGGCKDKYTRGGVDRLHRRIVAAQPKLVRAFRTIHRLSPRARILAVDYLAVVPDHGCYPTVPASNEDMRYISAKFRELNRMVARAARAGGAELVRTYRFSVGHDLCTGPRTRYAETFGPSVNDPAAGIPAHPNSAGARAQARAVLHHLNARR